MIIQACEYVRFFNVKCFCQSAGGSDSSILQ